MQRMRFNEIIEAVENAVRLILLLFIVLRLLWILL